MRSGLKFRFGRKADTDTACAVGLLIAKSSDAGIHSAEKQSASRAKFSRPTRPITFTSEVAQIFPLLPYAVLIAAERPEDRRAKDLFCQRIVVECGDCLPNPDPIRARNRSV